jgi:hypothetical protein
MVPIQTAATLRRLLAYLGATPEQLADFDSSHRRWGQGHCPDHTPAVPQKHAQDRFTAVVMRTDGHGLHSDCRTVRTRQATTACEEAICT